MFFSQRITINIPQNLSANNDNLKNNMFGDSEEKNFGIEILKNNNKGKLHI